MTAMTVDSEVKQRIAACSVSKAKTLTLEDLNLTTFPNEVLQLAPHLEALYLGGNCLRVLPASIWGLPHLEVLDVADNGLKWIEEPLGYVTHLKFLNLKGNNLILNPSFKAKFMPHCSMRLDRHNVYELGLTHM